MLFQAQFVLQTGQWEKSRNFNSNVISRRGSEYRRGFEATECKEIK